MQIKCNMLLTTTHFSPVYFVSLNQGPDYCEWLLGHVESFGSKIIINGGPIECKLGLESVMMEFDRFFPPSFDSFFSPLI